MSLPRYSDYKDSNASWLGEVPIDWAIRRLGFYFRERREKVSDKDFQPLSVTMQGIVPRIETAAKSDDGDNRKKVCAGDFVINSRSDRKGSSGLSSRDGSVSLISIVLEPQGVCGPFIHHLLRSIAFQEEFYRFGKGIVADLWSTNYGDMRNILLAMPPLQEQKRISEFLGHETAKIDTLVAEQRRLIELLNEKRQALISHAVTKGLNPDSSMIPSGVHWIGDIPKHWKIASLKRVASIQTGIAKGKDYGIAATVAVPYLRVANVQDGYLDLDRVTTINIPGQDIMRYLLRPGDVLMNEGGDFDKLGRGCVWHGAIDPCIHQNHVFAVRPFATSSEWVSVVIGSQYAQFYFMIQSKQSTNLASISSSNLMELPVLLPPATEQTAILKFIAQAVHTFKALVEEAEQAIHLLCERRTAIISAAVTGKIDVRHQNNGAATA